MPSSIILVSTHSRLKAAGIGKTWFCHTGYVSTHSRLKAAGAVRGGNDAQIAVSTHSRLKAAGRQHRGRITFRKVSTHSRLKAAGICGFTHCSYFNSFNTQPPEGGWVKLKHLLLQVTCFNTQPPEGGWNSIIFIDS